MSVLLLKTPGVIQPSGPRTIPGGFVWLAPVAGIPTSVGKGGRFVNPVAATTIGVAPCALSKKFTVVTVYCQNDASKAQVEAFRIGAGSTGVRWDFCTTSGGSNPDTWTLNGVVNGTNQSRNTSFNTLPRVNVASFDPASFEVTSGVLGGADLLSYSQTASMVAPSNGSVIVRGGPIQFYGIFILPYRLSRARAVELVRNPWQVFLESRPIWVGASSASGSTGTVAYTNANDTSAASGTTTVLGTLATTNGNDTSAAAGTTTVLGTLARTNANDTCAASGAVGSSGATGTLARTNANDTASAAGTTTVTGTVARTNANDSVSAAGWVGSITGTLARANSNDTAAAYGVATGSLQATSELLVRRPKKVYIRRRGNILLFDTAEQADAYIEAEEQAQEAIDKAKSRGAKKRIAARVLKDVEKPEEVISIGALERAIDAQQLPFDMVALLKQQDYQRIAQIQREIEQMLDEEEELLLLLA